MSGVDDLTAVLREVDPHGTLDRGRLAERLHARGVRVATPLDDLDVPDWLPVPDPGVFICADDLFAPDFDFEVGRCVLPTREGAGLQWPHEGPCWYAVDADERDFRYPANLHELVHDAVVTTEDAEKASGAERLLGEVAAGSWGPTGADDVLFGLVDATDTDGGVRFSTTTADGTLIEGPFLGLPRDIATASKVRESEIDRKVD